MVDFVFPPDLKYPSEAGVDQCLQPLCSPPCFGSIQQLLFHVGVEDAYLSVGGDVF